MIHDAPYIRDAEINGFGDPELSEGVRMKIVNALKTARNLVQMAEAVLNTIPDDTCYEEELADKADMVADLGYRLDELAYKAERW